MTMPIIEKMQIKRVYVLPICNLSPEDSVVGVLLDAVSTAELPEAEVVDPWGVSPTPEVEVAVDVAVPKVVDEPFVDVVDVLLGLVLLLSDTALEAKPMSIISH